jgi:4-hydroxythreonine-4-phosphate dehydrogenase
MSVSKKSGGSGKKKAPPKKVSKKAADKKKPVVGITMGDPAGIGPEIVCKAIRRADVQSVCRPLVFGTPRFLEKTEKTLKKERPDLGPMLKIMKVTAPPRGSFKQDCLHVVACPGGREIDVGRKSAAAGQASIRYLDKAIEFAQDRKIDALVTAPLNKASVRLAGRDDFVGHTEYLAERAGTRDCAMMFCSERLKVVLVTTHLPLREVADAITVGKITRVTGLANDVLKRLGLRRPRIGVAAMNPHAGEDGAFGDEDETIVSVAVRQARKRLIDAEGPLPADTLFHAAYNGVYDLVVAMYHDQALAPFKMIAFDEGVNITLGLPFIRTSVDHGTAFDIAGKGLASEESLVEAIKLAAGLAK